MQGGKLKAQACPAKTTVRESGGVQPQYCREKRRCFVVDKGLQSTGQTAPRLPEPGEHHRSTCRHRLFSVVITNGWFCCRRGHVFLRWMSATPSRGQNIKR
ncbi:unnamed protein product [Pylaiella littoralis]